MRVAHPSLSYPSQPESQRYWLWFCEQLGGAGVESTGLGHSPVASSGNPDPFQLTWWCHHHFLCALWWGKCWEELHSPSWDAPGKCSKWVFVDSGERLSGNNTIRCSVSLLRDLVLLSWGIKEGRNEKPYAFIPGISPVTTGVQMEKRKRKKLDIKK